MGTTREGESINVYPSTQQSPYGDLMMGITGSNLSKFIGVDAEGKIIPSVGFKIPTYDEINLTYIAAGNGTGKIETAIYKLVSVTVATLTLTYNSNDKIATVVKT